MIDERLSRHKTQENLMLRSEVSQLKQQMGAKDIMITNKDNEILRLLNQIATDMIRRSDVDAMIAAAVEEALSKANAEHERSMRAMAAEYEARIAELEKKNSKGGNNTGGKSNSGTQKKANTETFATKEEAIAALEEAQKIVNHLMRCRVNGKKVWAKLPETPLGKSHRGVMYNVNMILRKYLCGNAECNTEKTQKYEIGLDISRKTVNTSINKIIKQLRRLLDGRLRWYVLQDFYLYIDETIGGVFVLGEDGKAHLRTRYYWGIRSSVTNLVYFMYDKGSRSRQVIVDFLKDFIGTIQTDGATMYKIFEKHPELGITRLSCLVHIRRYFRKALKFEDETGIIWPQVAKTSFSLAVMNLPAIWHSPIRLRRAASFAASTHTITGRIF